MKKVFVTYLFIAFIPLFVFSARKSGFTINGTIKGLDTGTVELIFRNGSGDDTIVTTRVTGGRFTLAGQVPEPELARFNIRTGWTYSTSFFLENAEITFSLIKDADDKTVITGSSSNILYQRLQPQLLAYFDKARKYDNARQHAINVHDAQMALSTDSVWSAQLQQWTHTVGAAVTAQPKNYAGLYFIQWLLFHPPAYDTIMSLFMCLDPMVRNGLSGKAFTEQLRQSYHISPGQAAPEIAGNDTSGKPGRLSTLKGQIVLLDFWASYCGICRQENPRLKAVYEKYHSSGFEILSVSLDYEKSAWIKAIQSDKLPWPQVSELRGGAAASAAAYGVQDLPRNWLIDRKGNILTHDLSIDDLDRKLDELLNMDKR